MANPVFVSTSYRVSDTQTRSYSLRERLGSGKFLFETGDTPKRKVTSFLKSFRNARSIVFKSHSYAHWANTHSLTLANDKKIKSLHETSYWNPLAWFEVLALTWVNWATLRNNPLKDAPFSRLGSYFHIMLASSVYAVAKSANLVLSPLLPILYVAAVLTLGILNPWVLSVLVVGLTAFAGSVIYHGKQNLQARDEEDREPEHSLYGVVHALGAVIFGVINPWIRLWNKAMNLYETHPKLAIAAGLVCVSIILSMAVFPYVAVPAIGIFEFGSAASVVMAPVLHGMSALFTASPAVSAMLAMSTLVAFTVGAVDLTVRAFKEIAGWSDKSEAKSQLENNTTGENVKLAKNAASGYVRLGEIEKKAPVNTLHFLYYRNYNASTDAQFHTIAPNDAVPEQTARNKW